MRVWRKLCIECDLSVPAVRAATKASRVLPPSSMAVDQKSQSSHPVGP